MKPNSTYKMSKQTKRFLTTIVDPIKRSQFKRMMIDAELAAQEKGPRQQDNR